MDSDLGLSIDIGPAMMAKIRKENSWVLHGPMCQALTREEWEQVECKEEHNSFMETLHQMLGPSTMVGNQEDMVSEDTLQYDPHENK